MGSTEGRGDDKVAVPGRRGPQSKSDQLVCRIVSLHAGRFAKKVNVRASNRLKRVVGHPGREEHRVLSSLFSMWLRWTSHIRAVEVRRTHPERAL